MKELIEGRMKGKSSRGRKIIEMLEELYKKKSYDIVKKRAEYRQLRIQLYSPPPLRPLVKIWRPPLNLNI